MPTEGAPTNMILLALQLHAKARAAIQVYVIRTQVAPAHQADDKDEIHELDQVQLWPALADQTWPRQANTGQHLLSPRTKKWSHGRPLKTVVGHSGPGHPWPAKACSHVGDLAGYGRPMSLQQVEQGS